MFTNEEGAAIDPNDLGRTLIRLSAEAGVPRATPSLLRHTAMAHGENLSQADDAMQQHLDFGA